MTPFGLTSPVHVAEDRRAAPHEQARSDSQGNRLWAPGQIRTAHSGVSIPHSCPVLSHTSGSADIHSPTVTQSGSAFNNTYRKTLLDRATASTDQARAATPRQQQTEQLLGRIRPDNGPQNDSRSEHVSQDGEPQTRQRTPVRPHSSMTPALNLDALRIHGLGASTPTPSGGSRTVALSSSSRLSSGRDDDDTHMNNWDFMEGLREDEEGVGIGAVSLGKQRGRPDKVSQIVPSLPPPHHPPSFLIAAIIADTRSLQRPTRSPVEAQRPEASHPRRDASFEVSSCGRPPSCDL